jgi:hypothetical protein
MVQELAQLSLLDERDGRFGFRDLARARHIAELLNDGVRLSEIIRAVSEIRRWLPDMGLSAVRLHAGVLSDVQIEQFGGRTDKYGQFVLAVDAARNDPDELFDRAHAAEQMGDTAEAERLYRLLMKSDPTDASAPFNLGNMLRAAARSVEAEAALRAATRANPAFAEAWFNLADLLDDQGRSDAAVESLRKALLVAPDYIDAMFNLALLLQRKGAYAEAANYWRRYLASDRASEWTARARRSLKFCEIQVNLLTSRPGARGGFRSSLMLASESKHDLRILSAPPQPPKSARELHQRIGQVYDLIKPGAEQILLPVSRCSRGRIARPPSTNSIARNHGRRFEEIAKINLQKNRGAAAQIRQKRLLQNAQLSVLFKRLEILHRRLFPSIVECERSSRSLPLACSAACLIARGPRNRLWIDEHPDAAPFKLNRKAVCGIDSTLVQGWHPNVARPIDPRPSGFAVFSCQNELPATGYNPS